MVHYIVVNNVTAHHGAVTGYSRPIGGTFNTIAEARRFAMAMDRKKSYGIVRVSGIALTYEGAVKYDRYTGADGTGSAWMWLTEDRARFLNPDGTISGKTLWGAIQTPRGSRPRIDRGW